MLLLLADGTRVPVTELPGRGPWTFLVLRPDPPPAAGPSPAGPDPVQAGPAPGGAARMLTRFGRAVVPDLRGRPGWGEPPGGPGFLDLVDDLDQVRTRAGLGRPVLVGLGDLVPLALRAATDQPWAWRALVLAPPGAHPPGAHRPGAHPPAARPAAAELERLDLPVLVLEAAPGLGGPGEASWESREPVVAAVERLLGRLGGGPGWAGIAPDAPPR